MPETGAPHEDHPALVSVGRRDGWRPALVLVVVVAVLLAAAVWKPWEGARPVAGTTPTQLPGGSEGGLLPPITSGPQPTDAPEATTPLTPTTFAGLDLEIMGTADPHAAWGVAVAYVSRTQFDNAASRRSPTVTPVVSWELIEPGRSAPGPTLDHPAVTSIAVAATWPAGIRPQAVRLFYVGPSDLGPFGRPIPSRVPAHEFDLGPPLATLVQVAAGRSPAAAVSSGAFYLASSTPPDDPAAWIGNGWPAGTYQFQVVVDGGVPRALPFTIGGPPGP